MLPLDSESTSARPCPRYNHAKILLQRPRFEHCTGVLSPRRRSGERNEERAWWRLCCAGNILSHLRPRTRLPTPNPNPEVGENSILWCNWPHLATSLLRRDISDFGFHLRAISLSPLLRLWRVARRNAGLQTRSGVQRVGWEYGASGPNKPGVTANRSIVSRQRGEHQNSTKSRARNR